MQQVATNRGRVQKTYRYLFVVLTIMSLIWMNVAPKAAWAGKEGVFINDSVYFTLEDATLSAGTDQQMMSFTVRLNNNSASQIDYNRYGVKVTTDGGASYSAQLSQKGEGVVQPGSAANYAYVAKLPAGLTADQLKVAIFERSGDGMNDLGALTVANIDSLHKAENGLLLNLSDVDASLAGDAWASFQAMQAQVVPKDGKWNMIVDVAAKYRGTGSSTLPSALKMTLRDKSGKSYATTVKMIDSSTLAAGQTTHMIVTAVSDGQPDVSNLVLEFSRNDASGDTLGKINAGSLFAVVPAGQRVPYVLQGGQGLSMELGTAQLLKQEDNQYALTSVIFHNDSDHTVQTPTLTGVIVSPENGLSVDASLVISPDAFVAAGETAVYRFAAVIPDGVDTTRLQLLVSEQKAAKTSAATGSSGNNTTAGGTSTTGSASGNGGTTGNSTTASDSSASNLVPAFTANLNGAFTTGSSVYATPYELGKPIAFDQASSLIDPKLDVSVVELNAHTNDDNGYQTVVAKFKFTNKSDDTLALPSFDTELVDAAGVAYPGARQTTALQQLIPNTSYVFSYSYLLPPSANGNYALNILDNSHSTKYKVPISSNLVAVKQTDDENVNAAQPVLSFYPFNVKIEDWNMGMLYSGGTYTYKLTMMLDIQKTDSVIVDDTFSTMEFDLVDSNNRLLGTTSMQFLGTNKLMSGKQTISFSNLKADEYDYPVSILVYETIQTSSGAAKRLVATLKQ